MPFSIAAADCSRLFCMGELDQSSGYVDGITASGAKCLIRSCFGGGIGGGDVVVVVCESSAGEARGVEAGETSVVHGKSGEDVTGCEDAGGGADVIRGGLEEHKDVDGVTVSCGLDARKIFNRRSC
jgi:hypothetical protein